MVYFDECGEPELHRIYHAIGYTWPCGWKEIKVNKSPFPITSGNRNISVPTFIIESTSPCDFQGQISIRKAVSKAIEGVFKEIKKHKEDLEKFRLTSGSLCSRRIMGILNPLEIKLSDDGTKATAKMTIGLAITY